MAKLQTEFQEEKFRELILYIAERSAGDPRFGAVKLNKILYYSDFNAYRRLGASITGATYQKLPEGPAPREMLPQREILINDGRIEIEHRPYFNEVQQRINVRKKSNYEFSGEERAIVNEVIEFMGPMSGREASDYSHRELGWLLAELGEEIPYETAWLSSEFVPLEAIEHGRQLARDLS